MTNFRKLALLSIVLVFFTFGIYAQVGNHEFLNFDDDVCVTENSHVVSGLTGSNIRWAFTSVDYIYWQPVTWLSHMADVQLYGMNPGAHHISNILIHTVASCLLLLLLYRSTGAVWQSAFVAFCFALHPLHVESVAWLAERRDVLGALFWFLTLLMYREFMVKRTIIMYLLTLASFIVGIMAKPMLVTLPITMLIMDYWPLRTCKNGNATRFIRYVLNNKLLLQEKIPFFAGSVLLAVMTVYGQKQVNAVRNLIEVSFILRVENALISYVKYIGKTLWPENLAVLYPFPLAIPPWQAFGSGLILLFISVLVWRVRERHPYCIMGWLWFLLTLVPVIGVLQVGWQSMADRYVYVPGIGLFIIVAWGVPELAGRLEVRKGGIALVAGVAIMVSAALTWQQLRYWHDNISLYRHTLDVTLDNFMINNNLGLALAEKGDLDAAINAYRESIRIRPEQPFPHNNLCNALVRKGDFDSAIHECREAIWRKPDYAIAHNNLGIALFNKREIEAAINEYQQALRLNPNYADAHYNLGLTFASIGNLDAAILEYYETLRISPRDNDTHLNLGSALARKGEFDAAIKAFQKVLRVNPNYMQAQKNLNTALMQKAMRR